MRYSIHHTTEYVYREPVVLQPHVMRLRPRMDSCQAVEAFRLTVTPTPQQQSQVVDLDGNALIKVWFDRTPTQTLTIQVESRVETYRINPFDYLLEPWAMKLPPDYPASLLVQLQPYLQGHCPGFAEAIDPVAIQLAQQVWFSAKGDVTHFLTDLNDRIYKNCEYVLRETGEPLPAGVTWSHQAGSCRDFAVLFMEACRAMGLAARFVSGYQEGDPDSRDRHLHAWAEVYLPGAGWRGYDPTQGLAVADRHIALVASAFPRYAAPISGKISPGGVESTMTYSLTLDAVD